MSKSNMAALFGTDSKKETDGIVIEYGSIRVRIARMGGDNSKFSRIMRELAKPFKRMIAEDLLPEEAGRKLLHGVYARSIVLEWSGVLDDDGVELPFTVENCVAMFERWPEFFGFVEEESAKVANFRTATAEDDVKN